MGKILSPNYREEVEEFLSQFIENCDRCMDTQEMRRTAEMLLLHLEQYSQKH